MTGGFKASMMVTILIVLATGTWLGMRVHEVNQPSRLERVMRPVLAEEDAARMMQLIDRILKLMDTQWEVSSISDRLELGAELAKISREEFLVMDQIVQMRPDFNDDDRHALFLELMATQAKRYPHEALWLAMQRSEGGELDGVMMNITRWSLESLAVEQSEVAMEWVERFSDPSQRTELGEAVICGAGHGDLSVAFSLMDEVEVRFPSSIYRELFAVAWRKGQQGEFMRLLRDRASGMGDERDDEIEQGMMAVAVTLSKWGASAGVAWCESVPLADEEVRHIARHLQYAHHMEPSLWLDWLAKQPCSESLELGRWLDRWIAADWRALGEWLKTAPDGGFKRTLVRQYVSALSEDRPDEARAFSSQL